MKKDCPLGGRIGLTLIPAIHHVAVALALVVLLVGQSFLCLSAAAPVQVSLSRDPYLQSGTSTNIIIRWRTDRPAASRVRFGLASQSLGWQVTSPTPVTDHIVTLTNLAPDTRYYYAVGTEAADLAGGPQHYFFTAPTSAKPTRIWVLGDAGTAFNQPIDIYYGAGLIKEGQREVRDAYYAHAGSRHADVWLLLGDNAYNDGRDGDYQTNFFEIYPEVTRQSVIWPAIGNHEVDVFGTGDDSAYLEIFSLPTRGEAGGVPSGNERYYSFDYGNIHFVCLDSEVSSREPGSPQLTWLQADLAANTKDWLIVFWHSPPYSKGSHDSDSRPNLRTMRENVVPMLEAHGVDLVLCGHSHVYERSYLIDGHYGYSFNWQPTMAKDSGSGRTNETGAYLKSGPGSSAHEGTVYVVTGSAGWAWAGVGVKHPAMFTGMSKLGSLVIDVNGQRLDAKFLRETGEIDDYFTIIKGTPAEPVRLATFTITGGTVSARWKSTAGRTYRVERTLDLKNPGWLAESGPVVASGATTSWSGPATPGANESYYRVVQLD